MSPTAFGSLGPILRDIPMRTNQVPKSSSSARSISASDWWRSAAMSIRTRSQDRLGLGFERERVPERATNRSDDMGRLNGKVALVTGAARGQGRSHAVRMAEEGADIIALDICQDIESNKYALSRPSDLAETAKLVEAFDRRIVTFQADVREPREIRDAIAQGIAQLGQLDIVVANAGICPLGAGPVQAFADVIDVNLNGVINTIHAALPHLRAGASIIATGSVAAFLTGTTDNPASGPGGAGYSFAKRTVAAFINDLALALAPYSIRANAVHPTNCNTPMLQSEPMYAIFRPDLEHPTREDAEVAFPAMNSMPVGYVEPVDISNAIVYLASDEARYVTGQQLRIDAGAVIKARPFDKP